MLLVCWILLFSHIYIYIYNIYIYKPRKSSVGFRVSINSSGKTVFSSSWVSFFGASTLCEKRLFVLGIFSASDFPSEIGSGSSANSSGVRTCTKSYKNEILSASPNSERRRKNSYTHLVLSPICWQFLSLVFLGVLREVQEVPGRPQYQGIEVVQEGSDVH